ncbi:MAG: peptide ABC transporter substrate-binding protein [Desulfobacteraceae bacterium]|nr:MAG: peptide ABC transporter substrate-binding protein [Desulfobacteraceae bacterium]
MAISTKVHKVFFVLVLAGIMATWMLPSAHAAKRLIFSQPNDGTTLDNAKGNSVPDQNVAQLMYEGLVRIKNKKLVPGMAEKWELSPDGTVYTFTLRPSKWSDGKDLTAQDFEYAFRRLMDPKTASPYAFIGEPIKNGVAVEQGKMKPEELGVKALDNRTFQVQLEGPSDYFLSSLALCNFAPMRKDVVEQFGADFAAKADHLIFNGPYVLAEYIPQNKKLFKKNPNYWNAKEVKLDEIEVLVVADLNTALQMFQTGALDFAEVPSTLYPDYKDKAVTYVYSVEWMGFNTRKKENKPWLANPDFIKAVGHSIDRELYTQLSSRGLNLPAQRYVMPGMMGIKSTYGADFSLNYYKPKADKAKAQEYLKKAMTAMGIKDPAQIEISYQTISNDADKRRQAEVLQNMITKTLGIKFNITQVEYKQHWASLKPGDYETAFMGWVPDYDSPFSYLDIWTTNSYTAFRTGFSDATYDGLIKKAIHSPARNESLKNYFEAEKYLLSVAPMVPLHLRQKAQLVNPKVKGLNFYFIGFDIDAAFADKI